MEFWYNEKPAPLVLLSVATIDAYKNKHQSAYK